MKKGGGRGRFLMGPVGNLAVEGKGTGHMDNGIQLRPTELSSCCPSLWWKVIFAFLIF